MFQNHSERDHAKFSASGSERWLNCPGSVHLEEKAPPKPDSVWSIEGTTAHEVLEQLLLNSNWQVVESEMLKKKGVDAEMIRHCKQSAKFILKQQSVLKAKLLVEKKVFNNEISNEMFGTCDTILVQHPNVCEFYDFKYGKGHVVDPVKNTQLIQYALAVAESYDWTIKNFVLGILQPRVTLSPKVWKVTGDELKNYWLPLWKKGVERVYKKPKTYFEGSWCHFCGGKNICPLKKEKGFSEIKNRFSPITERGQNEKEKESEESFEDF